MNRLPTMLRRAASASLLLGLAVSATGCFSHAVRVEPITIAPVQVSMDVNLHVDDETAGSTESEASAPAEDAPAAATDAPE